MRVAVVSPNEVDSALAADFLARHGVEATMLRALSEIDALRLPDVGCVVLVEESLAEEEDLASFRGALGEQPAWSDLPILLVAARESSVAAWGDEFFPHSGNVTVLQRPLHPVTFVSAVRVALRSRQRQLEVRDLLAQREEGVRRRDEFLAMLAHELRNPLSPIRNAAFLLGSLGYTDTLFMKCRAMIEKQARHMTRLVDDLLDMSRLELGKVELHLQPVDIDDTVAAAAEACLPLTSEHRHAVNLRRAGQPIHVRADATRLEQVIGNLIVNAAKFTPPGGAIDIETRVEGGQAVVVVSDNGVGIQPEALESIFDLFRQESVTSARADGGLGIGLTLVKRLMELHGGSVRAVSEGPGRGSRFEIRLPRARPLAPEGAAPQPAEGGRPNIRVLVVEDGADARDSLALLLQQWGHEVLLAASGPEGVQLARESRPDVALIDIGLPGFDGYDVVREIRLEGSDWARSVRLIALTGYGQPDDRARAVEAGFDMHLLKPVDPAALREVLSTQQAGSAGARASNHTGGSLLAPAAASQR
jgi:signal transduction histidine kinase/CheY-like chemotaxis protein